MRDLLFDALGEISDRHIEEAATYKPKAKVISWKRYLALAACLVVALVGAFAVKDYPSPDVTTTNSYPTPGIPSTTSAVVTDESTTVAYAPPISSTTISTTSAASCPPLYASWEKVPLYKTAPTFTFNGISYFASTKATYAPVFDASKIKGVLQETKLTGYSEGYEKVLVDVLICEIEGVDSKNAIAVSRKDGLQGGYCIYIAQELYNNKDFNELLTKLNYKENLILTEAVSMFPQNNGGFPEAWISYYRKNPISYIKEYLLDIYEGSTETIHLKGAEQQAINNAFLSLLENLDNVTTEYLSYNDLDEYLYFKEDCLEFQAVICGYIFDVRFTQEGKLYFFVESGKIVVVCYHLSEDDFNGFLKSVLSAES